jgi:hypothetical protein
VSERPILKGEAALVFVIPVPKLKVGVIFLYLDYMIFETVDHKTFFHRF